MITDYRRLSADYSEYHRSPGNRFCHAIGIPLIVYAIVAWSRIMTPFPIVAVVLPVYFLWDARVGLIMTTFIALSALIAAHVPGWSSWAAFTIGWAFQFYGHSVYEKKTPAFAKNLTHLLIGPAWVATELAGFDKR